MTNEIAKKENMQEIETITKGLELYSGISKLEISKDQESILLKKVSAEMIEIKPTGEIYLGHVWYRRVLNEAFGVGKWALKPIGNFVKPQQHLVCREYALYINGQFAASAIGEQKYIQENDQMTWSDACEATKSNAIMRCCKDLGIGLECWDKKFIENFKREYCIQVWRKSKTKPQWRLKSAEPWYDETDRKTDYNPKPPTSKPQEKQSESGKESIKEKPQTKQEDKKTEVHKIVTGVNEITQKAGKNAKTGADYTRYRIVGENEEYITFDANFATLAKTAHESGLKVEIEYTVDKFGNNIFAMNLVEPDLNLESGELNV